MKRITGWGAALLLAFIVLSGAALPKAAEAAEAAAYTVSLKSPVIEVTSPEASGLTAEGALTVAGKSSLDEVWFCVRAPGGELVTYPASVIEGGFSLDLRFRFGPGAYTVWAGDNPTYFDGRIRFLAVNTGESNGRYLTASAWVDSEHPGIYGLAHVLAGGKTSDLEKVRAIHQWTTRNIAYDYAAYLAGTSQLTKASDTIWTKAGMCRDYAFVVAALARAMGLKARVVYGQVTGTNGRPPQYHAWNEVFADGRWVSLDATWDAGYVWNGKFVAAPTTIFFDPDPQIFVQTHWVSSYALH